jgi:hypothetical protein
MSLSNYSDLKTTVANYLGRSDLTAQIPTFISLAEIRLARQLRLRQMLKVVSSTTTAGDGTVGLPSDFLGVRDFYVDTNPRQPLSYLSPSAFTRDARPHESGKPIFYTQRGLEFELAPKPDTAYVVVMLYYAKPTALSDTNASNVFMANCPDALLYAALLEAEPYIMNDARLATWTQLYSSAITSLAESDNSSEYAGVPLSMSVTKR